MLKRTFDFFGSGFGLVLLAPFFLILATLIKIDSRGPVFFRQNRVGLHGKIFRIHKFRTMILGAERHGLQLTVGSDTRVTRFGEWLRKYKLDELPQLIDVFVGDMSIVGPRPEVPSYIDFYPIAERQIVLSVRPGITDRASIKFKNENEILGCSSNPIEVYKKEILPIKIQFYVDYVYTQSFFGDIKIIARTIFEIFRRDTNYLVE